MKEGSMWRETELFKIVKGYDAADEDTRRKVRDLLGIQDEERTIEFVIDWFGGDNGQNEARSNRDTV